MNDQHEPRIDAARVAPKAYAAMMALGAYVNDSGLEKPLLELVKIRVSQINGCAFCLHMHTSDARAAGETEARIYLLDAWRESAMYTPRERAALGWAESLTHVSHTHVPDEVFAEARAHFNELEIVNLTLAVNQINSWNRIAIGFRSVHPNER